MTDKIIVPLNNPKFVDRGGAVVTIKHTNLSSILKKAGFLHTSEEVEGLSIDEHGIILYLSNG